MPPIGQTDLSNLSDVEISDMLREYGVDVGPINMATRRTYERYLIRLRTGQASPPSQHPPVDDDEEDNEVILKQTYQTPPASASQTRYRQQAPSPSHIPTSTGDNLSRPSLSRKPVATPSATSRSAGQQSQAGAVDSSSSGGIPAWVKLAALLVVVVLVILIYINMESSAVSNIPSIQNKMEV